MTIESYRTDQAGVALALHISNSSGPTLRNLRINAIGAADNQAIAIGGAAKPTLISCDVFAGGGPNSYGIFDAETGSRLTLRGGSVRAEGTTGCGVFLRGVDSSIAIYEGDISGTLDGICLGIAGLPQYTNTAIVHHSRIGGDRYSVRLEGGNALNGASSQLTGPLSNQGSAKLFQCFDANYDLVQ